jgi:hypothetical protein
MASRNPNAFTEPSETENTNEPLKISLYTSICFAATVIAAISETTLCLPD